MSVVEGTRAAIFSRVFDVRVSGRHARLERIGNKVGHFTPAAGAKGSALKSRP
jgi:hypothetical protein